MLFLDRQRCVGSDDLPDEMGQVITKCVWPPALPKQVSRNKKRDRQGREKVPETVNKNKLQVTSYKLPDSL